jgi:bacterioferritin
MVVCSYLLQRELVHMKPQNPEIIDHLNRVLKNELTAINQYFLHAKILEDRGFKRLSAKEKQESIEEMEHADWLMERILFLEGLPNLQDLGKLLIGEDVEEMLNCDLAQEMIAIPVLREAIGYCESTSDYVSRELFEKILESEEEHVDWLETQMGLIKDTGIQNYLQSQMDEEGAS